MSGEEERRERVTADDIIKSGNPLEWPKYEPPQHDRKALGGISTRYNFRFRNLIKQVMTEKREQRGG